MEPFPAPAHDSQPPAGRSRSARWWICLALLICSPLLAVGGVLVWLLATGTPIIDEWQCSDGEAPYAYPEGGSACATEGDTLPDGATWDPLGNRPFICDDRRGWVEVEPVTGSVDGDTDCYPDDEPIPDGWRQVS